MKLGFASLIGIEPAPFSDIVQWAAENEFTAIEVNVGSSFPAIGTAAFSGHLNIAAIVRDGPGEIPELLARHGVEITSLAPMVNLLTADLDLRRARIEEFRAIIDASPRLPVRIGVNRGPVFTGTVGPAYRRTFTRQ